MAAAPILLFPGQGTERPGMSQGWQGVAPWCATLDEAEEACKLPLRRWMAEGPLDLLAAQQHAPFVVIAHSVALYRAHRAAGMPLPAWASGHSLGFLSAVVAAGVVELGEMFSFVQAVETLAPGRFPDHGMAYVIGLKEQDLRERLLTWPELELSNLNGTAQFTVSGPRPALERLLEQVSPMALKAGLLPVRHPLHASAMATLLPPLARQMDRVLPRPPAFPLRSFATGNLMEEAWICWDEAQASIALPVRWPQVVSQLGAADVFECGFGAQLASLSRWLLRDLKVASLQPLESRECWCKGGSIA